MFARITVFALTVAPFLAMPARAHARDSIAISEPGDTALFVIAVAGLIVGRHISRRPPTSGDDDDQA